jgi:hypothetical protein
VAYIEKRGPRSWRVRWRNPYTGDLESQKFTREDEAKLFRARVEGDVASGTFVEATRARTNVAAGSRRGGLR